MSYDSQTSTSLINKLRSDVDTLKQKIATLTDSKALGTNGGASVLTTWTTRTLNTVHSDPYGLITILSGNEFTVEAGEYQIRVISPYHSTEVTRTRLYDVTNGVVIGYSVSTYVFNQTYVYLYQTERIEPHKTNTYRIEYYCGKAVADGLGIATSIGDAELYTVLDVINLRISPE